MPAVRISAVFFAAALAPASLAAQQPELRTEFEQAMGRQTRAPAVPPELRPIVREASRERIIVRRISGEDVVIDLTDREAEALAQFGGGRFVGFPYEGYEYFGFTLVDRAAEGEANTPRELQRGAPTPRATPPAGTRPRRGPREPEHALGNDRRPGGPGARLDRVGGSLELHRCLDSARFHRRIPMTRIAPSARWRSGSRPAPRARRSSAARSPTRARPTESRCSRPYTPPSSPRRWPHRTRRSAAPATRRSPRRRSPTRPPPPWRTRPR